MKRFTPASLAVITKGKRYRFCHPTGRVRQQIVGNKINYSGKLCR